MSSLKARLNRGLAAILLVLFALHWLVADYVIKTVAENQMLTRLEHDGDSLLAFLCVDGAGRLRLNTDHLGLVYGQLHSGHYFTIEFGTQLFRSFSLGRDTLLTRKLAVNQRRRYHSRGPNHQPVLALARGVTLQGQVLTLTVAEDLTDLYHEIELLRLAYLGISVGFLLVAVLLQTADVRRALKPLAAVREDVRKVARGQAGRVNAPAPKEIQALVDELNRLLALVERRLRQSRHAIGNLAHALKTPLAILFHAASDPALAEQPTLRRQLQEQTEAMRLRIETELKRARLSGAIQPGAGFNPQEDLVTLIELLSVQHAAKPLRFELDAPDVLTPFDREDMLELIGNLADNACKWARSRVSINVAWAGGEFTVVVADDGPGCAEKDLAELTRRGLRLDETPLGHGLGLSIVSDMVAAYSGTLSIGRSEALGGLKVVVRL